jgi:hypothetical protein
MKTFRKFLEEKQAKLTEAETKGKGSLLNDKGVKAVPIEKLFNKKHMKAPIETL